MTQAFTVDEKNTVLLVIDIQERLVVAMQKQEEVIKNTQNLVAAAELLKIPTILTEQYPKGLGATIDDITQDHEFHLILEKTAFSAFTPALEKALQELGEVKIVVAGMETHVCVWQTVRDLRAAGYEVHLASDAMSSRTEANHVNGLNLMQRTGAVVSNTETILFDLIKDAQHSAFKTISQLIK